MFHLSRLTRNDLRMLVSISVARQEWSKSYTDTQTEETMFFQ